MPEEQKPRRRQARGERRVAQLLEAAADVFCKVGYTAATTNAIAREAGVSPGTLYQFFPNKEAIAIELGGILNQRMREGHGELFTPENASLPLREMLEVIVAPMIEFNCQNPAFLALVHDSDIPGTVVMEHDTLHTSLLERVETLLGLRAPTLSAAERARVAAMAFGLFKAGLALVLAHEGAERDAYIGEVKAALYGYLAPHVGTGAVAITEAVGTPAATP
ncbi:TetR/AcrR family transcriptional regulator [Streptomyces sp. NPDC006207]|nr:TetR/AcrR family transcriptional regulator [Streptomyces sp. PA03-5A]